MAKKICVPEKPGNSFISRLQRHPVCQKINAFMMTPYYFIMLGALTAASGIFALELPVYTCFILVALYVSFCGKDYLPLMPIVICCYIAPSMGNNPGKNGDSVFFGGSGVYLMCLAVLFAVSLIVRLSMDPEIGQKAFWRCKRRLLPGMLLLGGAYLLGGAFSGHYFDRGMSNLLFAFIQFAAIFALYFLFTGAVHWEAAPQGYLAWTGLCVGFALLFQLLNIYIVNDVIVDGVIQRERIYSGWGNYNNMGAVLGMMIPFVFYLACIRRHSGLFHLCALIFLFGVLLTCSRAAILVSVGAYVLSYALLVYKDLHTKSGVMVHFVVLIVLFFVLLLFHDELYRLFRELIEQGLVPSNRDEVYKEGLKQFGRFPFFGGTFYPTDYDLFDFSEIEAFSAFFPPRWHNTLIQMLASCGVVGLAAYVYHRVEATVMFVRNHTVAKTLIGLSLLVLLGTSLLDCHFFNVGPTLFYSMAMAYAEKADTRQKNW